MPSNISFPGLNSNQTFHNNSTDYEVVYRCYGYASKCVSRLVNCYAMMTSIPCLIITFVVYLILPERNVHRRALLNYVFSLLCGFISQVSLQLVQSKMSPVPPIACQLFGYFLVFFLNVSFFWMNVMSIDLWLAFSGMKGLGSRKDAETKMFVLFCIYAWGMPALLVLLVYLLNSFADKKAIYHPRLGESKCFLSDGYPKLFYFYLPMAILIIINVVLCILTVMKIKEAKKETSVLKRTGSKRHIYENDKQKFKVYVKLILSMGINWSLEVISWIILWLWQVVPPSVWYLTDFTNSAYGVIIFFIFTFKRTVWNQLKNRYYVWRGQLHLVQVLRSQKNRSSNFSTADAVTINSDYSLNEFRNGRLEGNRPSIQMN